MQAYRGGAPGCSSPSTSLVKIPCRTKHQLSQGGEQGSCSAVEQPAAAAATALTCRKCTRPAPDRAMTLRTSSKQEVRTGPEIKPDTIERSGRFQQARYTDSFSRLFNRSKVYSIAVAPIRPRKEQEGRYASVLRAGIGFLRHATPAILRVSLAKDSVLQLVFSTQKHKRDSKDSHRKPL
jgi:hypothetical protein